MSISEKYEKKLQKRYGIKPCSIVLNKNEFSKIRIRCTVNSSEKSQKLLCSLKQEDINTFSIKIRRKLMEIADIGEDINPQKRVKFSEISPVLHKGKGTLLRRAIL